MSREAPAEIRLIPIAEIKVLNPRVRNRKIFDELVASIATVGLKKPITVSAKQAESGYELVRGQGRMEAFLQLGQTEIPAIVIEATREECFVMSLVENLARRNHTPLELIREVGALKERGYSFAEIGRKIGFSTEYAKAICFLLEHGEERLLVAVERGMMPHSIAMEIARAIDGDVQRALAEAYEAKTLPGDQILAIRRIVEIRNQFGKSAFGLGPRKASGPRPTAAALARTYQKEVERQKLLVKKAQLTQGRLIFVVNALKKLLEDEHFVTLLRAEAVGSLPLPLAERLGLAEARR